MKNLNENCVHTPWVASLGSLDHFKEPGQLSEAHGSDLRSVSLFFKEHRKHELFFASKWQMWGMLAFQRAHLFNLIKDGIPRIND